MVQIRHASDIHVRYSAAKLAALSWDPENLKKAIVERVFANFRDKNALFTNFREKNAVFTSFHDKIAFLNYVTKTQCLALILSVQDKINQWIANLFY